MNFNKVLLMGRLTHDPELRYTPQGTPVADIGLAVNREYTTQGQGGDQQGERRQEVVFVDVTVWRRRAEVICQYLKKGEPIFIEGHLVLDSWQTQDGQKRTKLKVVADEFRFISARSGGGGGGGGGGSPRGPERESENFTEYEHPSRTAGSWQQEEERGGGEPIDDSEIPF